MLPFLTTFSFKGPFVQSLASFTLRREKNAATPPCLLDGVIAEAMAAPEGLPQLSPPPLLSLPLIDP